MLLTPRTPPPRGIATTPARGPLPPLVSASKYATPTSVGPPHSRHEERLALPGVDETPSHPTNGGRAPHFCPICMLHYAVVLQTRCCGNSICATCTKGILGRHVGCSLDTSLSAILAATPHRSVEGRSPMATREDAATAGVRPPAPATTSFVRSIMAAATGQPIVPCPFCSRTLRAAIADHAATTRNYADTPVARRTGGGVCCVSQPCVGLFTPRTRTDESGDAAGIRATPSVPDAKLQGAAVNEMTPLAAHRRLLLLHTPTAGRNLGYRQQQLDLASASVQQTANGTSPVAEAPSRTVMENRNPSKFAALRFGSLLHPPDGNAAANGVSSTMDAHRIASPTNETRVGESFEDMRKRLVLFPLSDTYRRVEASEVRYDPDAQAKPNNARPSDSEHSRRVTDMAVLPRRASQNRRSGGAPRPGGARGRGATADYSTARFSTNTTRRQVPLDEAPADGALPPILDHNRPLQDPQPSDDRASESASSWCPIM